jgi:hypothetical protein
MESYNNISSVDTFSFQKILKSFTKFHITVSEVDLDDLITNACSVS